jgi:hypothetical protein
MFEGGALREPGGRTGRQVVRHEGEYWTLEYAGETCRLRDTVGLRYLEHLLLRPHVPISAIEIEYRGERGDVGVEKILEVDAAGRERARINVTRALKAVLRRLATHHPPLERHLLATVQTGKFCRYTPDPRVGVRWSTAGA